jgi:hypothetical protein
VAAGIDHPMGRTRRARLDGGDAAVAYGHVGVAPGAAAAIHDVTAADQQVVPSRWPAC